MPLAHLIGITAVLATIPALAADISLTGDWSKTIGADDLSAGAGSDIRSPIESGSSEIRVDISNTGGSGWDVKLRRSDSVWAAGVTLSARRTTEGSGSGTISGGGGWLAVTGSSHTLFSGTGDRINVGVQLKLEGLSVTHAPDAYATTVTYSVE